MVSTQQPEEKWQHQQTRLHRNERFFRQRVQPTREKGTCDSNVAGKWMGNFDQE